MRKVNEVKNKNYRRGDKTIFTSYGKVKLFTSPRS
jgi:hypothetical protein